MDDNKGLLSVTATQEPPFPCLRCAQKMRMVLDVTEGSPFPLVGACCAPCGEACVKANKWQSRTGVPPVLARGLRRGRKGPILARGLRPTGLSQGKV